MQPNGPTLKTVLLLFTVFLLEFLYATRGVNYFLFAGKKRVAFRTDINADIRLG